MSAAKPADLGAARDLARRLAVFDMPGTAETIRDMADEIDALRDMLRDALEDEGGMGPWVDKARVLLSHA